MMSDLNRFSTKHDRDLFPANDGHVPANNGYKPVNSGHVPANNGYTLANSGYAPVSSGHVPANNGYTLTNSGYAPVKNGHAPVNSGHVPANNGYIPVSSGYVPVNSGHVPLNNDLFMVNSDMNHFPAERVQSVSQINKYINDMFKTDVRLSDVWIKGEISNFRPHYSGHMYFTLKDASSSLRCVMFKSAASKLRFSLENGMKTIINGGISVFERDGAYQLYCEDILNVGVGDLHVAFEQLKKKLYNDGLFDALKKKSLPMIPRRVYVVTSETGSVVRDIINIAMRRYPMANIAIYPVQVQGAAAAAQISNAIERINADIGVGGDVSGDADVGVSANGGCGVGVSGGVGVSVGGDRDGYIGADIGVGGDVSADADVGVSGDVIIIARGGGSIEDLWPFNEEIVARAVYASSIPVVSAVGHETDITICDYVADLRAPTPSAAAELVFPDIAAICDKLQRLRIALRTSLSRKLKVNGDRLNRVIMSSAFSKPLRRVEFERMRLDLIERKIAASMKLLYDKSVSRLSVLSGKLDSLNPFAVLARGYSVVTDYESGAVISSARNTNPEQRLHIEFHDGKIRCQVLG